MATAPKPTCNFSFGAATSTSDIPVEVRLTDTQLISDCPQSFQNICHEIWKELEKKVPEFEPPTPEIDLHALNKRVKAIKKDAKRQLMARLKSLARQHDLYDTRLKLIKDQLTIFKEDLHDQRPITKRPTRFITDFVDDVHKMYESLKRDIDAYGNYLRPREGVQADARRHLAAMLQREREALVGIAGRLGELSDAAAACRADLVAVARERPVAAAEADVQEKPSLARDVERRFKEYQRDIRRKAETRDREMDLFGQLPPPPAKTSTFGTSPFSFGSGAFSTAGRASSPSPTPPQTPAPGAKSPFSLK
jgi:hypothetical protein